MGILEDIHKELDFKTYEEDLRRVVGVWKSIEQKQAALRKNPATAKQYRAFLTRCIKQVRDNDPEFLDNDAVSAATEFNEWLLARRAELGLDAREQLRFPVGAELWAEKNLKPQYDNLMMAWSAVIARPSKRTVGNLKQAYEDVFQAFLKFYSDAT